MYRLQVYTYRSTGQSHKTLMYSTQSQSYTPFDQPLQLQEGIYRVATFGLCGTSAVSACPVGWLLLLCEFLNRFLALWESVGLWFGWEWHGCGLGWVVANLIGTDISVWDNKAMSLVKRFKAFTFKWKNATKQEVVFANILLYSRKVFQEKLNSHRIYIMLSHFRCKTRFGTCVDHAIHWGKTWLSPGTGKWFWLCSCGEVERSEVTWNWVVVSIWRCQIAVVWRLFETRDDQWCAAICMLCLIFLYVPGMHRNVCT